MCPLSAAGPGPRSADAPPQEPRPLALLQLIAILTLAVSTLIAATAVSIGLARAAAPDCMAAATAATEQEARK
ncbi:MAG TPA: hypothetical protein VIY51_04200 [Xanthobacteraceae bacterium]